MTELTGETSETKWLRLDVAAALAWKRNPKLHAIDRVVASIQRYGFRDNPAFDKNLTNINNEPGAIVFGNGRIEALVWMHSHSREAPRGIKIDEHGNWYVPIEFGLDSTDEAEAEAFGIDHNALTLGGADLDFFTQVEIFEGQALADSWSEIANMGKDLVSYDGSDLDTLLKSLTPSKETSPGDKIDKADECQEKWGVQPGDLWIIGRHRLYCGNCENPTHRGWLFGGAEVKALITDPPYGIAHDTDYRRFTGGAFESHDFQAPIEGDDKPFDPAHLLGYETVVLWGANNYLDKIHPGTFLVWDKRHMGQDKLMSDGEIAWLNRGHGTYIFNHTWSGFMRDSERGRTLHPTQKPVALCEWCLTFVPAGVDTIYDPYAGSGSMVAACEGNDKRCLAMEIEPKFCAVILERMEEMGLTPQKENTPPSDGVGGEND